MAAVDSQREDLPRISVETLDDWRRIKRNYTLAALTALDEQLSGNNSAEDRQVLLAHLHRVCSSQISQYSSNLLINNSGPVH